jgi:3-methyladenine DNA glycosylase AlkC
MPQALKDCFFTRDFFDVLSAALKDAYPAFDAAAFDSALYDADWPGRTLMERARHAAVALDAVLPGDYRAALDILRQVAPVVDTEGFNKLVYSEYVALRGLDDWDASLPALEAFTQVMSAEFAVRPFILQDLPRMMDQMRRWADHPEASVRRLASEGCRPRLPWGIRLHPLVDDPAPILPILEALKQDPSEDVRRSVANNLNDIAKDNPAVVVEVLGRWQAINTPEMDWLIRHALRTLIKRSDPAALALLGYPREAAVTVHDLTVDPDPVALGERTRFTFTVTSTGDTPQNLMIDFVVQFMKANGKQAPKVFKLTKQTLAPGESAQISGRVDFKPISTRVYYPGEHAIEIQINGARLARVAFVVTA